MDDTGLEYPDKNIAAPFSSEQWGEQFTHILKLEQASELLSVPRDTIYGWRSRSSLGSRGGKAGNRFRPPSHSDSCDATGINQVARHQSHRNGNRCLAGILRPHNCKLTKGIVR